MARLQEEYTDTRTGDMLNRGFSGYNTRWALLQLPHLIQQTPTPPALATVFFGANDAAVPESRQHVPLEEFASNLEAILALLRSHWPACHMIVITPPPMDQQVWDTERGGAGMRTLERTRQYAAAALAVAARAKCGSIDLFTRILSMESWKDCLCDGLHLSSRGNAGECATGFGCLLCRWWEWNAADCLTDLMSRAVCRCTQQHRRARAAPEASRLAHSLPTVVRHG